MPGANGLIAYTKGGAVHTVRPDGSGGRLVARNAREPAWSPDGRRLAFVRNGNLWVADADGANARFWSANAVVPSWAPDNRTVAVRERDSSRFWLVSEHRRRRLTTGRERSAFAQTADWASPSGTLAFAGELDDLNRIVNLVWVGRRTVASVTLPAAAGVQVPTFSTLSWSPDGATLLTTTQAYTAGHEPLNQERSALVTVATGEVTLLATPLSYASWSPDGTLLCGWDRRTRSLAVGPPDAPDATAIVAHTPGSVESPACSWQPLLG